MNHDEKTTEIEIPISKETGKIVHVNFQGLSKKPVALAAGTHGVVKPFVPSRSTSRTVFEFLRRADITSPWVIRIIALALLVGLSFLIL